MSKSKNILLLDNYDSFTHNLFHYLCYEGDCVVTIKRNDEITLEEVDAYDSIVLSPGPGLPKDAGKMMQVIDRYAATKKILGVCLGHQALAEYYGASLRNSPQPSHGISTSITVRATSKLFAGLPTSFYVGRYHSWYVDDVSLPLELRITAVDESGIIMALEHQTQEISSVQFHPESILSDNGLHILRNWIVT